MSKVALSRLGRKSDVVYALTRGGKTLVDLARLHQVCGTRQAISLSLKKQYGITVRELERKPEWYARHMAGSDRELLAKLLDRKLLRVRIKEVSTPRLAAELGVNVDTLSDYLVERLKLNLAIKRSKTVMLTCFNPACGKIFPRSKARIEYEEKRRPDHLNFCSDSCRGSHWGTTYGFGVYPEHTSWFAKRKLQEGPT